MFKFQSIGNKNFELRKNQDYYGRLSMDSNKLEDNDFFGKSPVFLRKIGLIQYNTDTDCCLFGKYQK